ncbi:glutathione-dependent formaldehyde-activating enzyme [Pseudomassariella vexata]|uniref:Glutathione-dependent formaldehyde-activating enzyme n=1 Tax=Pseudomassariella vexata TaxID=1141098 RepID=A0A1Y2DV63_9PEZI|nr:glutathione-dependent formaldehyde-activating enzyme [Pseudomassariella vexata]ORY63161.1 glutathione-dependent formaldehyde-activating enzyme [Pseudomassariella vexata]
MTEQAQPLKTYRGNCHCAAYIFEVKLPEIKSAVQCNCVICSKKGALWQVPAHDNLTFVKGDMDTLSSYSFGGKIMNHKFCPHCGTNLMCMGYMSPPKPGDETPPQMIVNVRAIQNLNVWSLELRPIDGAAIPPTYEPPKFTGPEPSADIEGGKTYNGSCHCGVVKLALKTKPLDKDFDANIAECNCSICGRLGCIWIYPNADQVVFEGDENLTIYKMGLGMYGKSFCKICGVPIHNRPETLTEEQIAALPEEPRKWFTWGKNMSIINVRVLEGVDLKELNVKQMDGWNAAKQSYVNP